MEKLDGKYLKAKREAEGYSLREFAELIYTSKSSLQRWESSTVPENEELLQKIAEVFGMTVEELCDEEQEWSSSTGLSTEQVAELRFGVKWLIFPLALLFFFITMILL